MKDLEIDIKTNNAIDIHQVHFHDKIEVHDNKQFNVKTINLYSYQPNMKQMVSHMAWQLDGQRKIAAAYCNYDVRPLLMNTVDSLVWDIGKYK